MALLNSTYRLIKKSARLFGFEVVAVRTNKKSANVGNEEVLPLATYAPWLSDKEFNEIYKKIEENTLVDKYRCYELWQLVAETVHLYGALIEIGVWRGGSGAIIAKRAEIESIKDPVYLCDTFKGVVKAGERDSMYKGGEHAYTSKKIVEDLIQKLNLKNTNVLMGVFPDETSKFITEGKFRFCHIDVDVYESAKDILDWIWSKMVVGGIIVYDDYGFVGCDGIIHFVNEQRKKKDRLVLHNLNGHAIVIKLS